jgi:hypothetical protein
MIFKKIYLNRFLQPAIHILFWGLFIISPYFLFTNPNNNNANSLFHHKQLFNNLLLAAVFYFNAYVLYPAFYRRKKILLYILAVIATIAAVYYLSKYTDQLFFKALFNKQTEAMQSAGQAGMPKPHFNPPPGPDDRPHDHNGPRGMAHFGPRGGFDRGRGWMWWYFGNMIYYIFVIGISISYRIIIDNAKQEKIRKEKENENLKTELSFLRSQVSPHFIFNILNNMVSLARKKSDMLEPSLIELSKLMRYMLYENDDERVSLAREVEYLKSYIALQLLRFGDDVTIMFNPPENINAYYIEPMLLAPFVENAFKHGVGIIDDPQINIVLEVDDATGWLDFKVMNTIAPQQHTKDKSSGIGLANVRRRLELLYKEDYKLDIMQNDNVFITDLKLKLK